MENIGNIISFNPLPHPKKITIKLHLLEQFGMKMHLSGNTTGLIPLGINVFGYFYVSM